MAEIKPKEIVKQVLKKHQKDKALLVDILQDIQAEIGYLPKEALQATAKGLDPSWRRAFVLRATLVTVIRWQ